MDSATENASDLCLGCVYYPPNLPVHAYTPEDYRLLREKRCSFDFHPGEQECLLNRKTSCSLVDLRP